MKSIIFVIAIALFCSFSKKPTLEGTWEFRGGLYNGKPDGAPKDYKLHRVYTAITYNAYLLEKDEKARKYEGGKYKLAGDTCLETQTFSAQPSKLIGVTIHYSYQIRHDTLFLKTKLPNGNTEEDYWKKVKLK